MIYFIIPAYNEAMNIAALIESVAKKMAELGGDYTLVVVNDGSKDATEEMVLSCAKRYPVVLLNHETNKNVGQVFRTGFEYVMSHARPDDVIVTKEADNTGDLGILPKMLEHIREGYDLVLASCYAKGGKVVGTTFDRHLFSFVANGLLRSCFPIQGVHTYSSFYRAYRPESLKKAYAAYNGRLIEEDGFVCMVEMLVKLRRLPFKIVEVPMVLRCDMRKGASKMKKTQTILAYLRLIAKEFGKLSKDRVGHA